MIRKGLLISGFLLVAVSLFAVTGDVNNDASIDIIDALLVAQFYVDLNPTIDQVAADVDADNTISIIDALLIAQYYVGLITSFPADQGTNPPTPPPNTTIIPSTPCGSYPKWDINAIYPNAGERVHYYGNIYENNWHCQSQNPEEYSGPNEVWTLIGPCDETATIVPTSTPTPIPPELALSPLHVEGKWIKDENNNNVVLKGVALADIDAIYKGHRDQSRPTQISDIIDIGCSNGWDVDVFRLTIHPHVCDETGCHGWINYTPDSFFNNILDPAVQYVISKGKYVIIDWHYVGISWTNADVI